MYATCMSSITNVMTFHDIVVIVLAHSQSLHHGLLVFHFVRINGNIFVLPAAFILCTLDDLLLLKVCLGTMTWGEQNTEEEGIAQMDCAFDEYGVRIQYS